MGTIIERIKNWKTTVGGGGIGLALAGIVYGYLESAGCNMEQVTVASAFAYFGPQVMGAISTDNGKSVQPKKEAA